MELHNASLWYAFPYQNMEIHRTKILKEIILQTCWQCSLLLPVRFTNVFPFLFFKKISLDMHVLGLKMNFCIQCTDTIFGHAVFVKQKFYLIFALIFLFLNLKIRPLGLWKICHGSPRSPPWFCKESIRVGGSVSNPSWLWEESVNCGDRLILLLAIFHHEVAWGLNGWLYQQHFMLLWGSSG